MIDKKKLLKKAEQHIFSTGMGDSTSLLAKENMKYGLAKMHFIQKKFGLKQDATFVSSPDETISRNAGRWKRGISYGGKITWGGGKEKLVMLDTKPNACGMVVGALNKMPKMKDVLRNVQRLENSEHYINDIKVKWDLKKGNHFIDIGELKKLDNVRLPSHAVILHAGCSELKGKNNQGMGLYHDEDCPLKNLAKTIQTPFGPAAILEGSDVKEYMKFNDLAVDFAKKRRELALKELFGIKKFITNQAHQFMPNMNQISLGCHDSKPGEIYPVSLKGDEPSFLVKGRKNFSMNQIEELGFKERANRLGVMHRLTKANIVPHGGGYLLPSLLDVNQVYELKNDRFFELNMAYGEQKEILTDVRELAFTYRGLEVFEKTKRLDLCTPIAELIPGYVLKI